MIASNYYARFQYSVVLMALTLFLNATMDNLCRSSASGWDGYVYVVGSKTGHWNFYADELVLSFNSLRKVDPSAHVAIFSNIPELEHLLASTLFCSIHSAVNLLIQHHLSLWFLKPFTLLATPFSKTILLDTDTIIHRPEVSSIFDVLDDFTFAATFGNWNSHGSVYPDFNTGLIGVRTSDYASDLLKEWINISIHTNGIGNDQYGFREMFMRHKHDLYPLPAYFMLKASHMYSYPSQAVLTHDHTQNRQRVIETLIRDWQKFLQANVSDYSPSSKWGDKDALKLEKSLSAIRTPRTDFTIVDVNQRAVESSQLWKSIALLVLLTASTISHLERRRLML